MRPGPEIVEPGQAPGGLVVHAYCVATGDLLLCRPLVTYEEARQFAHADAHRVARLAKGSDVVIVIYDGDSGRRARPDVLMGRRRPYRHAR